MAACVYPNNKHPHVHTLGPHSHHPQALLAVALGEKTAMLPTFPCGVSRQSEEHLHQLGLKWLPVKCKGSSPPQSLAQGDMIV